MKKIIAIILTVVLVAAVLPATTAFAGMATPKFYYATNFDSTTRNIVELEKGKVYTTENFDSYILYLYDSADAQPPATRDCGEEFNIMVMGFYDEPDTTIWMQATGFYVEDIVGNTITISFLGYISFEDGNGNELSYVDDIVHNTAPSSSKSFKYPEIKKDGYKLKGWANKKTNAAFVDTEPMTEYELILVPVWEKIEEPAPQNKSPKTGDTSVYWFFLTAVAFLGVCFTTRKIKTF